MKSIWKFEVPIEGEFTIMMPLRTQIISFQIQNEKAYIWGIVELGVELETRTFNILGTGQKFKYIPGMYIGTIQMLDETLVFHLFEVPQIEKKEIKK